METDRQTHRQTDSSAPYPFRHAVSLVNCDACQVVPRGQVSQLRLPVEQLLGGDVHHVEPPLPHLALHGPAATAGGGGKSVRTQRGGRRRSMCACAHECE